MGNSPSERLRLDLFLKRSGLVKRRSLAATLCQNGYVTLNGRPAGPGKAIKSGDRVEVKYARKKVLAEVTQIPGKGKRTDCYKVLDEQIIEEDLFGD
jgi:ribosomal 50S subunit-recycling heat shock protein